MKFINALISTLAFVNAAPVKQNNTQILLDEIQKYERSNRISFRFLKNLARTYTNEIEKYSLPNRNMTVFLPSDDGFLDISLDELWNAGKVANFVKYHAINDAFSPNDLPVNASVIYRTILGEDLKATRYDNGTVNIFTAVNAKARIIGSATLGTVQAYFVNSIFQPPLPLIDTVFQTGRTNFTTILQAYYAKNQTLANITDYTIFVPSESAWVDFLNNTCKTARNFTADSLRKLVDYHIYPSGRNYSATFDLWNNQTVTMANNQTVIGFYNGTQIQSNSTTNSTNSTIPRFVPYQLNATLTLITPTINATVIEKDILAKGGSVQIIDQVLIPANLNASCNGN